jgi:hypothetical protein
MERGKEGSYFDHWVNYRESFRYSSENWCDNLPDEIRCGDKYAIDIYTRLRFSSNLLRFVNNEYLNEIKEEVESYFEIKFTLSSCYNRAASLRE